MPPGAFSHGHSTELFHQHLLRSPRGFTPPWVAIAASFVLVELILTLFTGFPAANSLYATATFGTMITYFVVAIAVGIYPYVRKNQFEASLARQRIAGVPVMTVAGVVSVFFLVFMSYYMITVPGLYGFSTTTLLSVIVMLILSGVIYYASRAYHLKKDAIDIDMAFRELPPE